MESILPNDQQILQFIRNDQQNSIMSLWCVRQTQLYIDEITNRDNCGIVGDIFFKKISINNFRCKNNWIHSDEEIINNLPSLIIKQMNRKTVTQMSKLIRMIYFFNFLNENNKDHSLDDVQLLYIFKYVYFKDFNRNISLTQHQNKKRNII